MKGTEDKGGFYDRIIERLEKGEIKSKKILIEVCLINGMSYTNVRDTINRRLTDKGIGKTLGDYLSPLRRSKTKRVHNTHKPKKNVIDVAVPS